MGKYGQQVKFDHSPNEIADSAAIGFIDVLRPPFCTLATHSWLKLD